jgi:hypothetical protein
MGEETEKAYLDAIASSTGTDLSTLRTTFVEKAVPPLAFWLAWLSSADFSTDDDISNESNNNSNTYTIAQQIELFESALTACPHAEVGLLYIDFLSKLSEDDKLTEEGN